jgi:hypothetical protein
MVHNTQKYWVSEILHWFIRLSLADSGFTVQLELAAGFIILLQFLYMGDRDLDCWLDLCKKLSCPVIGDPC